jgi:hypothetical protein
MQRLLRPLRLLFVAKAAPSQPVLHNILVYPTRPCTFRICLSEIFDSCSMMGDPSGPLSDAVSHSMVDLQTSPSGSLGAEPRGDLQPSEGRSSAWSCSVSCSS